MSNQNESTSPPNPAFEANRRRIDIQVGQFVQCGESVYRIVQVLDFNSVIGTEVQTGRSTPLRIDDLRPVKSGENPIKALVQDIEDIADEDWKIAQERFAAIKPLLGRGLVGRDDIAIRAKEVGRSPATLYRWVKLYKAYEVTSALIPKKRGWTEGKSRIPPFADKVIGEVINGFYLTPQRRSVQKTVIEVLRVCQERGIEAPHPSTIRARIAKISERRKLRERGYKEKAKNQFLPASGKFPNADYPLSVVQIDHTPADIILVDDKYRKPIGRPWITLAIDVYSRMVVGYYLSFDPPSETSVAMCISHAILPKEEWLLLHKVDSQWPVWGVPRTVHADNAAEFRSNNFLQSCLQYKIHLVNRPVKQPRYGGHIERMLGTLLREMHGVPGTTFSSIKDREGYNSEKQAIMTKSEFETWLVTLITKVYHQRLHAGIGMSPLRQWERGIFGNGDAHGCGVPARPADRLTVLLDFLPSFHRTVQTFGVTIDGLSYYAEALRPWINAKNPKELKLKREFIFRRDPRDISTLWFFDPELKQYFKIPFADLTLPSMSIWEYRQALERLKREGVHSINEREILRAITELRTQVEKAEERSKKARRLGQRRREHERKVSPAAPLASAQPVTPVPTQSLISELTEDDIPSFGDIS